MRRVAAHSWAPILAASLITVACSPPAQTEQAATPATPPAAAAAEGAAITIPVPTDLVVDMAIPGVVAAGTPIQLIKTGFEGAEGPVGMPDGSLLFTETRASRITRIDPDGNISTFVEHSNESNGLAFDPQGRLISVQRAPNNQKVGVLYPSDKVTVLADSYNGKPFNRLNDIVVDRKGGVYFSDSIGENTGLYYIPPGAKAIRIFNETTNPNGVQLSPDEKTFYANWEDGEYLLAFDVKPDGTLGPRRNFARYESVKVPGHKDTRIAEGNGADGLAIDSEGRIYACTNRGVEVFSPQGQHLGTIRLVWGEKEFALRKPANLAFAGRVDVRSVTFPSSVVRSIVPRELNVILQRVEPVSDADRFDLIVATNILLYYDVFEQALAAANIATMLQPRGFLLSNDRIFELPGGPIASAGRTDATYLNVPGSGPRGDQIHWFQRR